MSVCLPGGASPARRRLGAPLSLRWPACRPGGRHAQQCHRAGRCQPQPAAGCPECIEPGGPEQCQRGRRLPHRQEAAQLQLVGTELVVLTACETAAGEQQSGEGLYGLQHALNLAGARTTLLSLWKVDDDATPYIMERYYRLLQQGKGRMVALLAVQNEFRSSPPVPAWEDYRYWAALQLVGETGPIEGL